MNRTEIGTITRFQFLVRSVLSNDVASQILADRCVITRVSFPFNWTLKIPQEGLFSNPLCNGVGWFPSGFLQSSNTLQFGGGFNLPPAWETFPYVGETGERLPLSKRASYSPKTRQRQTQTSNLRKRKVPIVKSVETHYLRSTIKLVKPVWFRFWTNHMQEPERDFDVICFRQFRCHASTHSREKSLGTRRDRSCLFKSFCTEKVFFSF